MKKLLVTFLLLFCLTGCVKYQVIQKLDDNMYHLTSTKGDIIVIITPLKKTGKHHILRSSMLT